jgi:RNA polymerase sigma-70 factor, ECF subfamily
MADIPGHPELSDSELVRLTLRNQEVFVHIVNRYQDKLLRYIMRISGVGRDEAQDILQDVFLKAYRNLNSFNPDLKFSSWIYRITHNQVISHYRKRQARPQGLNWDFNEQVLAALASDIELNGQIDLMILKEHIDQALERIDPKYREVLMLRFLDEKDYREIADIIKKPMGTVATLLNRAKKQLRLHLKELYER